MPEHDARSAPTARGWPDDPRHHYVLHVEGTGDRFRGFVTVQSVRQADAGRPAFFRNEEKQREREEFQGLYSRLALRFDLPGPYSRRSAVSDAAYEAARRFADGQLSPVRAEYRCTVRGYRLIGGAGFRVDNNQWEAVLTIKRKRAANAGGTATQKIEGANSSLRRNTFPTADRAAQFALEFGERMVIGAVPGLKI